MKKQESPGFSRGEHVNTDKSRSCRALRVLDGIATDEAGQPLYAEHQPTEKRRDPARCGHCAQTTEGA